ncbi:uncharacterized protein LOC130969892 [Arachis stenosperma]|uniref:uncharacterized protein LOC130969892 n=1 Tax=Arachis stenosperma TaxID=217475 RepID=UPI0025AC67B7|nr:uncharacterized protein LOC130969892 [Arachis stenosperma]XP_057751782.1 uncharacterized protein LOC130969892 [Arachis stenosperma]
MDREEENKFDQEHAYKQALTFCVVKIWPKDSDMDSNAIQVLRLFERKDEQIFRISEKIRDKVFGLEKLVQRMNNLKTYYLNSINGSIEEKKKILTQLYQALDLLSFEIKRRGKELLTLKMLHTSKKLAQENSVLRKINMNQQQLRESDTTTSTSHLTELRKILKKVEKDITCDLRECLKNQVKFICDELMEMRKKKRALETKIKHAEREIEWINEEIWSFQIHLKDNHCRKEASLCILTKWKGDRHSDSKWDVRCGNLEYNSVDSSRTWISKCPIGLLVSTS